MIRRRLPVLVLLPLASVLALTACSAPDGGDAPQEASPLTEYLGALYGTDRSLEQQQEEFAEQERAREDLVAACMKEQGFDYTPNPQSAASVTTGSGEWEPEDREWVAQYGYGVVDFPGRDEPVEADEEYVDLNADYMASLSESERAAYQEALTGPPVPEDQAGEDGSYEYDWAASGCFGSAQHELDTRDPVRASEHEPLMDALSEFYSSQATAPGLVDLNAEWSSCMTDAGHPGFAVQFDARNSIVAEVSAFREASDEPIEDSDPKLQKLAEKEIALALADLDCREKTDYRAEEKKVQVEQERRFIADHQAELDALKADVEQGD
ncbi:hypothetical protein NB037_10090 [Rathayibacter sp. ZW T2_19]|uniref:Uncharacterized protein n=1 Tax=Rathayibacter rubneri TaxID=2950106 RepID=A0A9X2IUM6_9MICO|nr:hypothetical protein [Rathayibacter rubneri]MCM6762764.1 hypothetical protein [Rathayibacter rubneri]